MSLAHVPPEPDSMVAEARQQIASNVRAMLGRRSQTQTALADYLGLSQPVVSRRATLPHTPGATTCDAPGRPENAKKPRPG